MKRHSEIGSALSLINAKLPLCVIQFPVGTWGFVGSVPLELKWVYDDSESVRIAMQSGEGFARAIAKREGKIFKTCTWQTKEEAIAAATAAGYSVAN